MTLVLLCAAVVIMCMPRWLSPLAWRLDPHESIRFCTFALALGALLLEVALVLFALPATLNDHRDGSDTIGRCIFGNSAPGGLLVRCFAAAFAVLFPVLAYQGWRRAKTATEQMRAEPALGVHEPRGGIDLVWLPTESVVAYSIDGPSPQIVLSDGLVALLAPDELDLVMSHEAAHLHERHGRILRSLAALEASIPAGRWTTTPLRVAIERCADEAAIRQDPVRREALLDAIMKVSGADVPVAIPAFTRRSSVFARTQALLATPPPPTRTQRITDRLVLGSAAAAGVGFVCAAAYEVRAVLCWVGICCA